MSMTTRIPIWVVLVLLSLIGGMATMGWNNNAAAMNRFADSMDRMEERMGSQDVKIENHTVRLDRAGL